MAEPVHFHEDDRRDEQRQQLRDDKAADHGDAERLAQFRTCARAECDGERPKQRAEGRHHDRPEPAHAGLVNGGCGRLGFFAHQFHRDIDHHDRVFLDDADQHQQADQRDDREIHAHHLQRHQRAEGRRRQAGEDGQRMDETLVKHAENDIDGQHRRQNEEAGIALALLEDRRRAAIAGEDILRQAYRALDLIDPACGIGKRHAIR